MKDLDFKVNEIEVLKVTGINTYCECYLVKFDDVGLWYIVSFIVLAFKMEIYLQKSFQIIMQALTKK